MNNPLKNVFRRPVRVRALLERFGLVQLEIERHAARLQEMVDDHIAMQRLLSETQKAQMDAMERTIAAMTRHHSAEQHETNMRIETISNFISEKMTALENTLNNLAQSRSAEQHETNVRVETISNYLYEKIPAIENAGNLAPSTGIATDKAFESRVENLIMQGTAERHQTNVRIETISNYLYAKVAALENATNNILKNQRHSVSGQNRDERAIRELSAHGLFIIGHARSGTTVLQEALNQSPDIFILGEANLQVHHDKVGFSAWYNAMHKDFKNPPSKNSVCPVYDEFDDGLDFMLKIRKEFKYVGDKLAFRHRKYGYEYDGAYNFFQKYFLKSHYVCTLRDPVSVLGSSLSMFSPEDLNDYAISYMDTLVFILNCYMTFDKCFVFVFEDISPKHFERLGESLGSDLSNAFSIYKRNHQEKDRYELPQGVVSKIIMQKLQKHYDNAASIFSNPQVRPSQPAVRKLHRQATRDLQLLLEPYKVQHEEVDIRDIA